MTETETDKPKWLVRLEKETTLEEFKQGICNAPYQSKSVITDNCARGEVESRVKEEGWKVKTVFDYGEGRDRHLQATLEYILR